MSTASAYLAEAYAMTKLQKEKMKTSEKEEAKITENSSSSSSGGDWFTKMFNKVHPVTAPSSNSATNLR